MSVRWELPEGLSPEDERAVIAALERYFAKDVEEPSPWALAGRLDATGVGALQSHKVAKDAWRRALRQPFARRGTPPFHGRGDAA